MATTIILHAGSINPHRLNPANTNLLSFELSTKDHTIHPTATKLQATLSTAEQTMANTLATTANLFIKEGNLIKITPPIHAILPERTGVCLYNRPHIITDISTAFNAQSHASGQENSNPMGHFSLGFRGFPQGAGPGGSGSSRSPTKRAGGSGDGENGSPTKKTKTSDPQQAPSGFPCIVFKNRPPSLQNYQCKDKNFTSLEKLM